MTDSNVEVGWRNEVAKQLRFIRSAEKDRHLVVDREASDYLELTHGLQHFLKYVSDHQTELGTNLVLDIGAGLTKATAGIASSELARGLQLRGTVLRRFPEIDKHLGNENVLRTPVEILRGVKDSSVAAVLSVNGLAWSAAPQQAIRRIDQVLVPGGIIKATFLHPELENGKILMHTHSAFTQELQNLGYDIAIASDKDKQVEIVVAVKSGGYSTAEEILRADEASLAEQVTLVKKGQLVKDTISSLEAV